MCNILRSFIFIYMVHCCSIQDDALTRIDFENIFIVLWGNTIGLNKNIFFPIYMLNKYTKHKRTPNGIIFYIFIYLTGGSSHFGKYYPF